MRGMRLQVPQTPHRTLPSHRPAPRPPPNTKARLGVWSRRRCLRAAADVEAAPVQTGWPVRAAPRASMPRRRSRRGSPGQGCRRQTARSSVGSSTQPSKVLAPPMHRCRQQRAPVVRRGKQPPPRSKAPAPAPSPMPPPAGPTPRPASCHVATAFVPHPTSKPRLCRQASCAAGKHAAPAQSKRLATTVLPAAAFAGSWRQSDATPPPSLQSPASVATYRRSKSRHQHRP